MLGAMKKRIAKGISDFREFITENGYFIDKTHLIKYLIDNPSKVHLITRPRRFGKTLNLSMIRYFFEASLPGSHGDGPPNGPLFDGLAISSRPECMEYMGQYPVIHLSFKDVKGAAYNECMDHIQDNLSDEFMRHEYLLDSVALNTEERELFAKILYKKGTNQDCAKSIKYLSSWLHRAYSKPAYILLDEYDTPLHGAYVNNFYDEMIRFIRSFMVQTFKDNPHLKQAVVIGILKVAQESIFSDFNNPQVSTLLDSAMKDCFGFTEAEVEAMAESFGQAEKMTGIREWYNGYVFGSDTTIYNPWSIINYIGSPEDGLCPYWINTSDNAVVREVLRMDKQASRDVVSRLLRGEKVRKTVYRNISYPEISRRQEVVWSFLLHGGYLKASGKEQVRSNITYNLSIPNLEVETAYGTIIKFWLEDELSGNDDFFAFIRGIKELNPRMIEQSLGRILFVLASHHDMAPAGNWESGEKFYHGLLLGLLAYLGAEYTVESNREYGMGRADIVLLKRSFGASPAEQAVLFELKQESADKNTPLEQLAQEAHSQAIKRYLKGLQTKCKPGKCLVLGVGFRGKQAKLVSSFGELH